MVAIYDPKTQETWRIPMASRLARKAELAAPGSVKDLPQENRVESDCGRHQTLTSGLQIHRHLHAHVRTCIHTRHKMYTPIRTDSGRSQHGTYRALLHPLVRRVEQEGAEE